MDDNEPISALSHFIGLLFSIAGLALLVVFAVLYGKTGHIVGFSIFGSGLILLYLASATYHFISKTHPAKEIFKTIDYSMIYVLIASTYTPLVLVIPQRGWGWGLFGVIWGLASLGIALSILIKKDKRLLSAVLYITMGWLAVIALPVLLKSLPLEGIWWLVLGGILYTFGVIFLALERIFPRKGWFGMHEVFHIFVMGGSFSHFWFMFKYVLYI
ncbi:MAG: hemolysin III family protein [Patescibacteria group bacterium]